jgi:MATE family multidrug resistance protein
MFGIGLPLHALFNYMFIVNEQTSFGLLGAPLANTCTYTVINIMFFAYFKFFYHNRVWNGFSSAAFQSIGQYVLIGLPGIAMVCTGKRKWYNVQILKTHTLIDWWAWDLVTIISGWFGETTLAAQSVVLTTYLVFFQVPHGIGSGANARIGNLLGSQCPQLARLSTLVIQWLGAVITGVLAIATYFGRFYIARAFTEDAQVIAIVTDAMLVVSFLVFADGMVSVALGILRGCGMQVTGAALLFCGYYVLGIPLGYYFATYGVPFVSSTGMGLVGLYSGLMASLIVMFGALTLLLLNMDWDLQVHKCVQRLQLAHSATLKSPLGYGFIPHDDEQQPLLSA